MSTIIIARYNENLDWLYKYQEFKILVYNKGSYCNFKKANKIINLPNIGRESHTWLHHIVTNYDDLDEVNIFLQGRIDDLGKLAYKDVNKYYSECKYRGFSVSRFGILGPFHWNKNLSLERNPKYSKKLKNKSLYEPKTSFKKLAKTFMHKIPIFTVTSYGGCFAVSKDLIRQYDLRFYKELLNILSKNENPIEGHYMERLWCYLFTKNKYILKALKDVLLTKYEILLYKFHKFNKIKLKK